MNWLWKLLVWLDDLFDEYVEYFVTVCVFVCLVCWLLALSGCMSIPRLKLPSVEVTAPKEVGKPGEASEVTEKTGFRVPANSRISVIRTEPLPKEGVLLPGKTEWTVELPEPTDFVQEAKAIKASTGTVDTTLASKRIEAAERRWLLFTAIGCAIGAILARALVPSWHSISNGLFLAAAVAGVSWKVSELPAWLWAVGLVMAGLLVLGYKRAEWDANKDGIPDFLQKK